MYMNSSTSIHYSFDFAATILHFIVPFTFYFIILLVDSVS